MRATFSNTASWLDSQAMRSLAGRTGPCITMVIPDRHPGAPEGSQHAIFRTQLAAAKRQLAQSKLDFPAENALAALEEIGANPAMERGGPGWAIFRTPDFSACYRTHKDIGQFAIASHPLLVPFVSGLFAPQEALVLGLNTKSLELFEYTRGECTEVPLPANIPANPEEAGKPPHAARALESRSMYGSPKGNSSLVRFSTVSDRENQDAYLHDFFEVVDRGLQPLLAGRPLILMGVQEEIAAYHRAAEDASKLISGGPGSVEFLTATDVAKRAQEALHLSWVHRGECVLLGLKEMRDRRRVALDAVAILRAAAQGRVHQLCVRMGAVLNAPMDPGLDRIKAAEEDLVNAAVVETLRGDGEVYMLPQVSLPPAQPLAAVLRY